MGYFNHIKVYTIDYNSRFDIKSVFQIVLHSIGDCKNFVASPIAAYVDLSIVNRACIKRVPTFQDDFHQTVVMKMHYIRS